MPDMTPESAAALRKAFPPEMIGKLPKPYRADATKGNCGECGKYHGLPAAHVDYAGHAAVTDRLLQVDNAWTWEPVATDPQTGAPLMVNGGLWIRLTVCGVTRYGWGDGKSVKECIGDAIRNAAMRFGVALDLWAKESLVEGQHDEPSPGVGKPDPAQQEARALRLEIASIAETHGWDLGVLGQEFTQIYGTATSSATPADLGAYLSTLQERAPRDHLMPDPEPPRPEVPTTPPGPSPAPAEQPAPRKTPEQYREALLAAKSKAECWHLLRDLTMDGFAQDETADANGAAITFNDLATQTAKGLTT